MKFGTDNKVSVRMHFSSGRYVQARYLMDSNSSTCASANRNQAHVVFLHVASYIGKVRLH